MGLMQTYRDLGTNIGRLVEEKDQAYGSSFQRSQEILKILYPEGVQPDQYCDMLAMTRVIDKLFRIANRKEAFGESPWQDIAGYGILGVANEVAEEEETTGETIPLQLNQEA
jgi:selenophosphate synthase